MNQYLKHSIRTGGFHTRPNRTIRALTTPSACGSHPFNTLKGNLFPNLTVLCSTVFLFFLLLAPLSSRAVVWSGTVNLTDGQTINENISLSGSMVTVVVSGVATINGVIFGELSQLTVTGTGSRLILTSASDIFASTTISSGCELYLYGDNATTGGPIVNNSYLIFDYYGSANKVFSFPIIGSGNFIKRGSGKLTLTGINNYSGWTSIEEGILQIGNGSSGSINNTSSINLFSNTAVLRFVIGGSMSNVFSKKITGFGNVEINGDLYFTANHDFTGTTTIEEGSVLYLGTGSSEAALGNLMGDIIVKSGGKITFQNQTIDMTYSGSISGSGDVHVNSNTKSLTLNGGNYYMGNTYIVTGKLILGVNGEIVYSNQINISDGGKLDISAGNKTIREIAGSGEIVLGNKTLTISVIKIGTSTYYGKITGEGNLKLSGGISIYRSVLYLKGINSYTGTTTVGGHWTLQVDCSENLSNTSEIILESEILLPPLVVIGTLRFEPGANMVFNRVITGSGNVEYKGEPSKKLTLNAVNTYTGSTIIESGTLVLGTNGKIESSSEIKLTGANSKLDISSGNKTIKNLNSSIPTAEVILDTKTITIGTAEANHDGGGEYSGLFSGNGGNVIKRSSETLTLKNANHTANGTFTLIEGVLKMQGANWEGNFTKSTHANLEIIGELAIGGALSLNGGNTTLNLTGTNPSKITVTGAVSVSGTNTLNITTGEQTNYVLMEATSGITNPPPFTVNSPGISCTLTANVPTQLLLSATVSDFDSPVPGAEGVITGTAERETAELNWTAAEDILTPEDQLRYFVYQSLSNNISTVADCETNGTLLNSDGTQNITTYNVTGLNAATNYYFNVVVADMANNKAAYVMKNLITEKAILWGLIEIGGNPVFDGLIASSGHITSEPLVDLGEFTYQWKRDGVNIGDNLPSYRIVEADISHTITLTITTSNCNGSLTSAPSEVIQKAPQTPPPAPTKASATGTSITLEEMEGCAYRINGREWQTSLIFTGLQPKTTYIFDAYKLETATHFASGISPSAYLISDEESDGIEPITNDEIQITVYPNPTTGELNIQSSKFKVQSIEIYDVFGRKVYDDNNSYGLTVLRSYDLTPFPAGVYFLKITTETGIVTKKIINN